MNPGVSRAYRFDCNATGGATWSASDVLDYVRVTANCQNEKAISAEKSNIGDLCS